MGRKRIDDAIRQKIVEAHEKGLPMRQIASQFGTSLSSVCRIVQEKGCQDQKDPSLPKGKAERQRRIEEIERRIGELEEKILELEQQKKWRKR
jgi:hypothetical protein